MPANPSIPVHDITAVVLAGGRALRMGGEDKGLIELHGKPLLDYVIAGLRTQAGHILVNANRNLDRYRAFGYPVIEDIRGDYLGPLAGMAAGMQACNTPLVLAVPCDSPFIPGGLTEKLYTAMMDADAEISVARDDVRMQPVFALLRCALLPDLLAYLEGGGRKIDTWYREHRLVQTDFSAHPDTFLNLNTPDDKRLLEKVIDGM